MRLAYSSCRRPVNPPGGAPGDPADENGRECSVSDLEEL